MKRPVGYDRDTWAVTNKVKVIVRRNTNKIITGYIEWKRTGIKCVRNVMGKEDLFSAGDMKMENFFSIVMNANRPGILQKKSVTRKNFLGP